MTFKEWLKIKEDGSTSTSCIAQVPMMLGSGNLIRRPLLNNKKKGKK